MTLRQQVDACERMEIEAWINGTQPIIFICVIFAVGALFALAGGFGR